MFRTQHPSVLGCKTHLKSKKKSAILYCLGFNIPCPASATLAAWSAVAGIVQLVVVAPNAVEVVGLMLLRVVPRLQPSIEVIDGFSHRIVRFRAAAHHVQEAGSAVLEVQRPYHFEHLLGFARLCEPHNVDGFMREVVVEET